MVIIFFPIARWMVWLFLTPAVGKKAACNVYSRNHSILLFTYKKAVNLIPD